MANQRRAVQFNLRMRKFASVDVPEMAGRFHKQLMIEALEGVVPRTPWRTGRARQNWQVGVGRVPRGEKRTADPVGRGRERIAAMEPYQKAYITNNVPYIVHLENGSSAKAPNGMVRVTLAEIRARIESIKRKALASRGRRR